MALFRVYVNTGFVQPFTKIVEADSEATAFDKVADQLKDKGSPYVLTYDEILERRGVGQSAEEYIAARRLVCCGNSNVYLSPGGIIKLQLSTEDEGTIALYQKI